MSTRPLTASELDECAAEFARVYRCDKPPFCPKCREFTAEALEGRSQWATSSAFEAAVAALIRASEIRARRTVRAARGTVHAAQIPGALAVRFPGDCGIVYLPVEIDAVEGDEVGVEVRVVRKGGKS